MTTRNLIGVATGGGRLRWLLVAMLLLLLALLVDRCRTPPRRTICPKDQTCGPEPIGPSPDGSASDVVGQTGPRTSEERRAL
jgi:hypothetical protein